MTECHKKKYMTRDTAELVLESMQNKGKGINELRHLRKLINVKCADSGT